MASRTAASDILLASKSWGDLRSTLAAASEGSKGEIFEALVQAYLRTDSKYDFKNVWSTHGEVPKAVLTRLNLFNRDVTGIDLVAETSEGRFWAVQAKYHQDEKWSLSRKEATGLIAGRNRAHGEFELALICTTANGRSANLAGEPGLEFLMGDVWRGLDGAFFERLHAHLRGLAPPPPEAKIPRPHQQEALDGIAAHFADHSRGKVVMPCATGKSLIGFWSAEKLGARRVLVAVPNLSLVRQLLKDWTEQTLAHDRKPRWIVVCSDDSVADAAAARELGVKVDTDAAEVASWMKSAGRRDLSVVFTTYQSGKVVGAAARKAGFKFDLGIFDEAHRTAGREGAPFAYLLDDKNVQVSKRVFMTATPRIYKGKDRDDVISMGDPVVYGDGAFKMTFLQAMDRGIIPNLTIVAVTVAQAEVEKLLRDRLFVRLQRENTDEVLRVEDLVSALALRKAMKKFGIRRTLGFYSSRKRCRRAAEVQALIGKLFPEYGQLDVFHVDGAMTAAERDAELRTFKESDHALITNVRVFVEGVDCPSMDAVIFADPRQSVIDIVQGVGRALRPFPGKEAGYAIIPTIIEDDGAPSDTAYGDVVRVTCALGSENEVILDYFAAVAKGRSWNGRRVFEVVGDVEAGVKVDLEKVNQAIAVQTYARTVEWWPFKKARTFVRRLELKSITEWRAYNRSGARPEELPAWPNEAYESEGWQGWGDFLGTGNVAPQLREFRAFEDARSYAQGLGFRNQNEWYAHAASRRKPADIPIHPTRRTGTSGAGGGISSGRETSTSASGGASPRPARRSDSSAFAPGTTGRPTARRAGARTTSPVIRTVNIRRNGRGGGIGSARVRSRRTTSCFARSRLPVATQGGLDFAPRRIGSPSLSQGSGHATSRRTRLSSTRTRAGKAWATGWARGGWRTGIALVARLSPLVGLPDPWGSPTSTNGAPTAAQGGSPTMSLRRPTTSTGTMAGSDTATGSGRETSQPGSGASGHSAQREPLLDPWGIGPAPTGGTG